MKRLRRLLLFALVATVLATGVGAYATKAPLFDENRLTTRTELDDSTVNQFNRTITAFAPNAAGQNKDCWCWAAASKIVGVHNDVSGLPTGAAVLTNVGGLHSWNSTPFYGMDGAGQYTADAGQRGIVYAIKHSDADLTGNNTEKEDALQLASLNTMTVGTWGNGTLSSTDIANMNYELTHGRWVIANVFPTSNLNIDGHSVVLTSVNLSTQVYSFWDPWTNTTGSFTKNNILNNTIVVLYNSTERTLRWVQYCK